MICRIVIQARMSSSRFPGKMLAPLRGQPLIAHVIERARQVPEAADVILATSEEVSDDPLALYAASLGLTVFRGELENVARRFQQCIRQWPCDWFVRISGDSPVIDPELISAAIRTASADLDMVTNVAPRSFPPGQSVEVLRSDTFLSLDTEAFAPDEKEHVTLHIYRNADKFRIRNLHSGDESLAQRRLVVDSLEDLASVERLLAESPELTTGYGRRITS